ncbi:molybdenum cofactor guanylyltransferase [Halobacillus sp. H74]|uniref:molybdenum cofactor guanylyltransferase n=1 Tax=Halobacillus sp. H74 TaxID=3457436 RepID=UPI003FCDE0C6
MSAGTVCGVVLNGGGSTRMGRDKADLLLGDVRVLDRITSTLSSITSQIVINQNQESHLLFPIIEDRFDDAGPLGGIHAVMKERGEEWFLITASDTPFISAEVYHSILRFREQDRDAIIPVFEGRIHPLSGLYNRRILPELTGYLESGDRKVAGLLEKINTYYMEELLDIPESDVSRHFFNMNTPEEYERAEELLKNGSK